MIKNVINIILRACFKMDNQNKELLNKLKGKSVAIVGMGKSWFDYNLAKSHGVHFDEVWVINGVASVIYHDRDWETCP